MLISLRGLAVFRPLQFSRILSQTNRPFSFGLRRESNSLRFTNTSYSFPLSPQTEVEPEPTELSRAAFLEEPSDEYGHLDVAAEIREHAEVRSSGAQAAEVILRLIARGETEKALAARDELLKHGVQIAPDAAFSDAALEALSIVDPGTRSKRFLAWWSLTPLHECREQLSLACTKLMDHPFDIPLLMDFCLLCAKTGHAHAVEQSNLLKHIFRYGHPNATTAFLVKLEHEAQKHRKIGPSNSWMSMRNLAIRMHLIAGREEIATELYDAAVANGFELEKQTSRQMRGSDAHLSDGVITTKQLKTTFSKDWQRPVSELAKELRILRRILSSRACPPLFQHFLADFICAYEYLGRKSRAIKMLRVKVFKYSTPTVRTRWVAGEQMAYSMRKKTLANLRTFINYCLADNILNIEARRVLKEYRERRRNRYGRHRWRIDWKVSQKSVDVDWKVWPSNTSLSLAWKAVLQLSSNRDVFRLYALFLKHVEAARSSPNRLAPGLASTNKVSVADEYYYDNISHTVVVPPVVFPDPYYFHYFVVALATKCGPKYGARVIRDMARLNFAATMDTWGAVCGAYARSGDFRRVMRILDYMESGEVPVGRERPEDSSRTVEQRKRNPRWHRSLLATYNSALRGFTEACMYPEARVIQQRMEERGLIRQAELRKERLHRRTKALLHRLSRYEKGRQNGVLYYPGLQTVFISDRRLRIDKSRADWLKE